MSTRMWVSSDLIDVPLDAGDWQVSETSGSSDRQFTDLG